MADLIEINGIERKGDDAIVNVSWSKVEAGMPPQIKYLQLPLKGHAHDSDEQIRRVALDYLENMPDEA